jgi:holo-[acyl-carrier protein] synthase
MKAIGIDAVELARMSALLRKRGDRFVSKIFTDAEKATAVGREGPVTFYSGRFAAKEAVLKALGTGWAKGLGFKDVEILRGPTGAPSVVLHGKARTRAKDLGITRFFVSITHTRRDATAVCAAE